MSAAKLAAAALAAAGVAGSERTGEGRALMPQMYRGMDKKFNQWVLMHQNAKKAPR
jgi:hypothetical protein